MDIIYGLETFDPKIVRAHLQSFDTLSHDEKEFHFSTVKSIQACSMDLTHVRDLIVELTPKLVTSDGLRKNEFLYLLALSHFRLGNAEMSLDLVQQLSNHLPPDPRVKVLMGSIARKKRIMGAFGVAVYSAKVVAVLGGVCFLAPKLVKSIKHLIKNNLFVEAHGGKVGVALKFPGKSESG